MSPEQAEGGEVSDKTDMYAWGIVMYEMLSGNVPFKASTPGAVLLKQIQEKPVLLRKLRREIPASLERAVMQTLEKNPEKRQRDMREVARTLQQMDDVAVRSESVPTTITETIMLRRIGRGAEILRKPLVWGGGLAMTILAAGWWFVSYVGQDVRSPPLTTAVEETVSSAPLPQESELDQINNHIREAGAYRDRGEYLRALAELARARAIDPSNKLVNAEIARTRKACLAEQRAGIPNVVCD
jgi:serine/threonine protein kinase